MANNTTRRQPSFEQRAVEGLRALARPDQFRVRLDAEGYPVIPGRYGQIEWFDGTDLAVYSDRICQWDVFPTVPFEGHAMAA